MRARSLSISRRSLLAALAPLLAPSAFAQNDKFVRVLLPVSPGSSLDVTARGTEHALSTALGRQVIVENQPGAGGLIGTNALMRSAPDGSTISLISANHVIFPLVLKSVRFHPVNDFTAITVAGAGPMVFVVNPNVPAKNPRELAELLKNKPDQYNYASSGIGTILHLGFELFLDDAGVRAKHVPYKGGTAMVTDIASGQCDMGVVALSQALPYLKSGALQAIGLAGKQRNPTVPDLPTFAEQGFSKTLVDGWFAVIGPKGIPAPEVQRINAAVAKAYNSPEARALFDKFGTVINVSTPEYAHQFLTAEYEKFAAVVKKIGLEPQ